MSETTMNGNFNVPPEQDFDTLGFQGSMQQVLQENVGNFVIVEFLIGTGNLISRQGVLYSVSTQYLVLYDEFENRYVVCDIFSVKFVTFLVPGYRPGQIPVEDTVANEMTPASEPANTSAGFRTPAQAAFAHTVRRGAARH